MIDVHEYTEVIPLRKRSPPGESVSEFDGKADQVDASAATHRASARARRCRGT